ncbi:hypothetical protein [Pseudomonas sp. OTU5201]|uniref:hypothetical protein n=1 Tax=Pseudomonas sp. OTU5201 TaxID=3043850 RepID=UPI00313DE159
MRLETFPEFSPPRLWQARGEDGQVALKWKRRSVGVFSGWPVQWVIDRSLCIFHCLDLEHVPRSDRPRALALKLLSVSPFRHAGHYVVWRGGRAMVWSWDEREREEAAATLSDAPKRYRCIPESLLQALPKSEGATVRMVRIGSGVDLQVWQGNTLAMSHCFPMLPDPEKYLPLLRGLTGVEVSFAVEATCISSLNRPWANSAVVGASSHCERWLPHVLAASLALGGGLNMGVGFSWWWAGRALQAQYDELSRQVEPVLIARSTALRANEASLNLVQASRATSQSKLLSQVAALLDRDSRLLAWRFGGQELELQLDTRKVDPRFYVNRFMEAGNFENVRVEPVPRDGGIILSLSLSHAGGEE